METKESLAKDLLIDKLRLQVRYIREVAVKLDKQLSFTGYLTPNLPSFVFEDVELEE